MQTEKEYLACKEVRGLRCESVGDYSLPDYNGDVKKVLMVKTKVFPSGKFVGDESLEFSGSVGYDVVYVDAESIVTHAEFTTDYDAAIRINSENYRDSDVRTEVATCNLRLVGPRKFSVKTVLESDVCISEKKVHLISGDAFMEYEPEYLSHSAEVMSLEFASSDLREVEEEIVALDGAIADEVEILLTDASATVESCDASEGGMTVKGNIRVNMLYRNGECTPVRAEKHFAYTDEMRLEYANDFENISPRIEILSLKGTVVPTEEGVKLCASVGSVAKVSARKNSSLTLVSDAFLKERGTVNEYSDFNYTEHVCSESSEHRFDASMSLSELEIEGFQYILYSDATARVDSCETYGNSLKISGEIKFSGIACQVNEGGGGNYMPVRFSAPFEQNVNINCQIWDNMHVNCHVAALDVKMEINSDRIDADCTLTTSVSVSADRRKRCLGSSYITDEEYSHDACVVTVYYPDSDENLFDIAKKFHTSTRAIAESNRLTEAVFSSVTDSLGTLGVGKLIIK